MLLGIQYVMRYAAFFQKVRQLFRVLDSNGADQCRLAGLMASDDIFNDRTELFLLGFIDNISPIDADHRCVGRNDNNLEFVNLAEFGSLGISCTGHSLPAFHTCENSSGR